MEIESFALLERLEIRLLISYNILNLSFPHTMGRISYRTELEVIVDNDTNSIDNFRVSNKIV